ncbi:MAG TPA: RluA family pseudouridine synthase [Candidatus Acidoferrales bacterium]|nr:RluA family pseudouridine synthase [Candidatus Acidoferrales bacterium]
MKSPIENRGFVVPSEDAGARLDRFLAAQLPELSRTKIQSLIDEGRVLLNGIAPKASYRVQPGESVTVEIPPAAPAGVEAEPIALDVIYEDADIAVINKPANMIVHPGAGRDAGTLVAALLHRFGGMDGLSTVGGPLRPGIVHRLDKGTSGAMVIARNDPAHKRLVEAFRDREVEKTYIALLHGRVKGESGRIDMPIARDLRRRTRMTTRRREGRPARTDWRIRLRLDACTLVEADLHTGRTHQIRAHFSALGAPVVGDTLYGAPGQERVGGNLLPPLGRNFLHAARIAFAHPRTGKRVEFRAPAPVELRSYFDELARAAGSPVDDLADALRSD